MAEGWPIGLVREAGGNIPYAGADNLRILGVGAAAHAAHGLNLRILGVGAVAHAARGLRTP